VFDDWRHQTKYVNSFGKHTEYLHTISIGGQIRSTSAAPNLSRLTNYTTFDMPFAMKTSVFSLKLMGLACYFLDFGSKTQKYWMNIIQNKLQIAIYSCKSSSSELNQHSRPTACNAGQSFN